MNRTRNWITSPMLLAGVLTIGLGVTLARPAQACWKPPQTPAEPRAIDLVICLDTSGSMSGLINAAKQKLWVITPTSSKK